MLPTEGKIPKEVLGKHTQIVLTDRSDLSAGREFGVMSPATWRLADLFAKHHFLLNGLGWGGMPLHAVRKDLEDGSPFRAPHRRRAARWLDCTDVGGVADEVAAWARWPMVCRSLEANSGGNGQSAETAGHQEEGETVCENLAGRRCPYREKRRIRELPKTPERLKHRFPNYPRSSKAPALHEAAIGQALPAPIVLRCRPMRSSERTKIILYERKVK